MIVIVPLLAQPPVAAAELWTLARMTQTLNKYIIYSVIICASASFWHLAWLIHFGSPMGLLGWLGTIHGPEESSSWFHRYALFYFVLIPLVIFAAAIVFAWRGQVFRREYPSTFSTVILVGLTPGIYAAIMAFLSLSFL